MTMKPWLLASSVLFMSGAYASPLGHLSANASPQVIAAAGYCKIRVLNKSNEPVVVSGYFNDGYPFYSFDMAPYQYKEPIDLYNYDLGYCTENMYLHVTTYSGYTVYSGNTNAGATITIVPWFSAFAKVKAMVK